MVVMPFKNSSRADPQRRGWNNQEFAEFYRIKGLLDRAGLLVDVDHGLTDEGDPWFVFIRLDGEDVLVHFARVDNEFIAVSSIKQEIYKGNDIRSVVDKMLNCHPLMLSTDRKNDKLFLHPSAAITAFITAAFILSIDETKANSWSEVVETIVQNNSIKDGNINSQFLKVSSSMPFELLALLNIDSYSAGYQIAVLGAALIASELSSNGGAGSSSFDLVLPQSEHKKGVISGKTEPEDAVNNYLYQEHEHIEGLQDGYVNIDENNLLNNSSNHLRSDNIELSKELDKGDLILGVLTSSAYKAFDVGSTGQYLLLDGDSISFVGIDESVSGVDEFLINSLIELSPKVQEGSKQSDTGITNLISLVESAYEAFEEATNEKYTSLEGIGIAVDETGELLVLTVNPRVEDLLTAEASIMLSTRHIEHSLLDNLEVQRGSVNFEIENETSSITTEPSEPLLVAPKHFPILGHSLTDHDGGSLQLEDSAIDVVFYDGGNVRVENFELGKDLLWFFLDEDKLQKSKSEIVKGTDLVLTFDQSSVLTFSDVFEARADIYLI
jgi:hypothetical protein